MKNSIIKNVISLYGFSIAKMVFPLVTLPYLTRVLSVDTYGIVSYVKSIMTYFQLLVDFGFLLSGTKDIVLVRSDRQKVSEQSSQIFFARILVGVLSLVVLVPMIMIISILRTNALFTLLSFIPVFLTAFLFDYVFRGFERMNIITIRFVLMKTISTALTFVFVHNDSDIIWIPILDILSSLISIGLIFAELKKLEVRLVFCRIKDILKKLVESAVYFASDIATTAFGVLITLFLGAFCTLTEVAYWSLCSTMVSAVQAMYTPIFNGIYPEMIKSRDLKIIKKTMKIFMPIVLIGGLFTILVADYAVIIVGGNDYLPAGNLLRAFVPVLVFSFPAMLFGWPTLGAIEKAKQVTVSTVCAAVIQVVGLIILVFIGHFELITIALIRGFSELLLLAIRAGGVWKNKRLFTNDALKNSEI